MPRMRIAEYVDRYDTPTTRRYKQVSRVIGKAQAAKSAADDTKMVQLAQLLTEVLDLLGTMASDLLEQAVDDASEAGIYIEQEA